MNKKKIALYCTLSLLLHIPMARADVAYQVFCGPVNETINYITQQRKSGRGKWEEIKIKPGCGYYKYGTTVNYNMNWLPKRVKVTSNTLLLRTFMLIPSGGGSSPSTTITIEADFGELEPYENSKKKDVPVFRFYCGYALPFIEDVPSNFEDMTEDQKNDKCKEMNRLCFYGYKNRPSSTT